MSKSRDLQSQTDVNLSRFAWRFRREIPFDVDDVEILLNKRPEKESLASRQESLKRKEKMLQELFVAATKILTDVQFQFFTSYHVLGMSETAIADAFGVTQPYISIVLSACNKKIKKHLKLL